jgi:tripartite ATP-independent transporter DctP family solute receptor
MAAAAAMVLATMVSACGSSSTSTSGGDKPQTATPSSPANAGGGGGGDIKSHTITFAYTTPATFPYQDGAQRFKDVIEKASDGKITVKLFPGGQLGNERDMEENILNGGVTMGVTAGGLAQFAPIVNLFELPFLINGQDHMKRIITSDVGAKLEDLIAEGGYKVVGWFSTGDSAIQTVKNPVNSPDDLKGVKLRAQEAPSLVDSLKALGANPTPMPFGDIYSGVQTGLIEGATLDWSSVNSLKLTEMVHYSTTPDVAFLAEPRPVVVSQKFWKSLTADEQAMFTDAMKQASEHEFQVFNDRQAKAVADVKAAGVKITDIDPAPFLEKVKPVWDKWAKQLNAEDIVKQIDALR